MRLMSSLWTGASRFRLRRDHLLVQTLALQLAAKNGNSPLFATDKHGEILAREMGWQVQIERWLDDIPRAGLRHVWALGKLHALAKSPFPVMQFDGDVLLFEPLPASFLASGICAQSVDYPHGYAHDHMIEFRQICGYSEAWKPYNCGLVGGNDHELVKRYATAAIGKARLLSEFTEYGTGVSMTLEQWSLGEHEPTVLDSGHPYYCDFLGRPYAHLAGERKQKPDVLRDVELTLAAEFPQALDALNEGCERILGTVNHPMHRFLLGGQLQ